MQERLNNIKNAGYYVRLSTREYTDIWGLSGVETL